MLLLCRKATKMKGNIMTQLTTEQKAKRYEVLEKALLDFWEQKIADAQYDDHQITRERVMYDWMYDVDGSSLLPEDAYYLFDTILNEHFDNYYGESVNTISFLKEKYQNFQKRIGG